MVDPLIIAAVLRQAAGQYASGAWRWNDNSRSDEADDRDVSLAICGAASQLNQRLAAYDCIIALMRAVGNNLGDWNRAKGRTAEQVIAALRDTADKLDPQETNLGNSAAPLPPAAPSLSNEEKS